MMKCWILESNKDGFLGLKKKEIPIPQVKSNEILIKVLSVSLNYRDLAILFNTYGHEFTNIIPCSDTCGIIVKIGDKVTKFKNGDRVINQFYSHWLEGIPNQDEFKYTYGGPLNGGLSEYMLINEESCLLAPDYLNANECSTLPIAALTSFYSLVNLGNLKKDQYVLIEGTGSVSLFGVQISHAFGAKSIVLTSGNQEKIDRVLKLGAIHVINYNETPNWVKKVLELTNGKGVDHVLEVVGGDNFNLAIRSCKQQAHVYSIGFLKSSNVQLSVFDLFLKRINIHGIDVGPKSAFIEMIECFKSNDIIPVVDTVYCFDDSIKAFQHLKNGPFGKIVISVSENDSKAQQLKQ